jgi:hypothetical protein
VSNLQLDKEIASGTPALAGGAREEQGRPRNDMNREMFEF